VEVKLFQQDDELYVLAKSEGRQLKENAIRRKRLARLLRKLRAMRHSLPARDKLLMRIGAAKTEAGRAFGFVTIQLPDASQPVTRASFHFCVDKQKLKEAELRDGHYLLRSNLIAEDPAVLWTRYVQLTQIESVFRSLNSELGIRPVYHRLERRVDAHILVAFLAYCLQVTLKHRLKEHAPGFDADRGDGQAPDNSNDRRMGAYRGRTLVDSAAIHRAGKRHRTPSPEASTRTSGSVAESMGVQWRGSALR
jgi:hypothetical protein